MLRCSQLHKVLTVKIRAVLEVVPPLRGTDSEPPCTSACSWEGAAAKTSLLLWGLGWTEQAEILFASSKPGNLFLKLREGVGPLQALT